MITRSSSFSSLKFPRKYLFFRSTDGITSAVDICILFWLVALEGYVNNRFPSLCVVLPVWTRTVEHVHARNPALSHFYALSSVDLYSSNCLNSFALARWTHHHLLLLFLTQTQVTMVQLWTLVWAGLLVLCAPERLNSPEENEVLKHMDEEQTKKQASDWGRPPYVRGMCTF